MPSLTDPQKLFIVQHFACYYSISEIHDLLMEQWELDVPANQLSRYNPLTITGKTLSKLLKAEFDRARTEFQQDTSRIAIAQPNWRLRELDSLYREAKRKKNVPLAAKLLEQAAQDAGGKFTNKREISGPGGKAIEINPSAMETAGRELQEWRKQQAASLVDLMVPPTE